MIVQPQLTENELRVVKALRQLRKRNRPTTLTVIDANGRGWYQIFEGVPMQGLTVDEVTFVTIDTADP